MLAPIGKMQHCLKTKSQKNILKNTANRNTSLKFNKLTHFLHYDNPKLYLSSITSHEGFLKVISIQYNKNPANEYTRLSSVALTGLYKYLFIRPIVLPIHNS